MSKIQNFKQNSLGHLGLEIGIYLGFGICHLEFAIAKLVCFPEKVGGYVR
jgi:hypothetical protein